MEFNSGFKGLIKARDLWYVAAYNFLNIYQNTRRHIPQEFKSRVNVSICRGFRLFVYIRRPESRYLAWDSFLTPFTRGIWTTIAVCVVLISTLLILVRKLWVERRCSLARNQICIYVLQALQFSLGAFCLQGEIWFWISSIDSKIKILMKRLITLHCINVIYIFVCPCWLNFKCVKSEISVSCKAWYVQA